ncbi:type IV fimbrial biogenesis protein FimT [Variovorax paradoxus]|uniref:GspH/FimT family pseudopilin n=1 Tax=Variovorax paradoxus TaxID=34073 RepID=UPI002794C4C9|nr:GspH/FimT family pseudopilin [Variovorax paradoxus]MDQ0569730.1 type IV fimbrial biogenesis protein FimT [Variovorax paradoxus]
MLAVRRGGRWQKICESGFTLVELMAVLAIMAILGSLGVPAFRDLLLNQRLAAASGGFVAALNLARSEAIQRSQKVHVVALEGRDWSTGWAVRIGPDNALQTLRKFERLPSGVSIDATLGDGFVHGLDYDSNGFSRRAGGSGFGAGCLTLKAESGRRASVVVSASGRARVCNPDVRGDCGSGACGNGGK